MINKLSKKGLSNLFGVETWFKEIDTYNEQEIDFSTFESAYKKFNFELSEDDYKE